MKNLRKYFCDTYIKGSGLELGPLHKPMPVDHYACDILYVDRYSSEKLREHYPELKDEILIEPHTIDDVQYLSRFEDATQDFVIASHIIEHMKNPIGAIGNWLRVLKSGGYLYLVTPDHRNIFDKDRPTTELDHMLQDMFIPDVNRDYLHYEEYAQFVDKALPEDLEEHVKKLIKKDYSIHFHCFTPESMGELLLNMRLNIANWFTIVEGPVTDPKEDHEFHFLLRKE